MFHDFNYPGILAASKRGAWELDDVISDDAELDFDRPFLPEGLARSAAVPGLSDRERLVLNQIRGHDYLSLFGLIEECILPFLMDHARPHLSGDDYRVRAILNFASEEAKHIHLFKRFDAAFKRGFGQECGVIGPSDQIAATLLAHDPLSVALFILMIEWMTQAHYLESVRDNRAIEPLFASLLRHHWIEEAQHAKLDTLIVEALAEDRDEKSIHDAMIGYFAILRFMDNGLAAQAKLNLKAFEAKVRRTLDEPRRDRMLVVQHQAMRWTYLGSGMVHPRFREVVGALSRDALASLDEAAAVFA